MKQHHIVMNTLFALSCALLLGTKSFAEPTNLTELKAQLVSYYNSGEYSKEFNNVIQNADNYITNQVNANNHASTHKKLAIVLDIDETSLSNYNTMVASQFCENKQQFDRALQLGNDPAFPSTLALYNHLLSEGVSIFFVTGRNQSSSQATISNLKAVGYKNWVGIYFRPTSDTDASVVPFKSQARTAIEQSGYHIIASIGDQNSDFSGPDVGQSFKLPNPFYSLP